MEGGQEGTAFLVGPAVQDTAVLFPCSSGEGEQVWLHHGETAQGNGTACLLEGAEDVLLWRSSGKYLQWFIVFMLS